MLTHWISPEVAFFLLFLAKELNVLKKEGFFKLLCLTDSDFLRICPVQERITLLTDWFLENIYQNLQPEAVGKQG